MNVSEIESLLYITFVKNSSIGIVEVIEPPQVVVPMLGQENAISFVIETYHLNEVSTTVHVSEHIVYRSFFVYLISSLLIGCKNFVW